MLSTYLPIDRRVALSRAETLPESDRGSVLLADLSGFTKLTEFLLTELGERRGPEELSVRLNRVYDPLIATLHDYGGAVVGFSGDAITCWFSGDDGRRALTVGLAMQRSMSALARDGFNDRRAPVGLKVAVASGAVRRWEAGDPAIQRMEVLAGAPVDEAGELEQLAGFGDVLVSSAVRSALGDDLAVATARRVSESRVAWPVLALQTPASRKPWPSEVEVDEREAMTRLPRPVFERARRGPGHLLAGLRQTVPVFVQFSGLDFENDSQAPQRLDAFIRDVQAITASYEGCMMSLTIGEKGSYLYVNFGVLHSHVDDPVRAVAAARDIVSLAVRHEAITSIRAGLASGRVRTGAYGGSRRQTYGALGDDVNLAARLMMHASDGQVVVSDRVRQANALRYHFEASGAVTLKGKSKPVDVYVVGDAMGEAWESTPVPSHVVRPVGRISERDAIRVQVERFEKGEGGCVVVEGEAGMGKSVLANYAMRTIEKLGVRTLVASGDSILRTMPYHGIQGIFRVLLGLATLPRDPDRARELIAESLPDSERHRAPLLAAVTPFSWPDNDFTRHLEGEARGFNTLEILLALLRDEADKRPLALFFEDVHWLDSMSCQLLRRIRDEVPSAFLMCVTRPLAMEPGTVLTEEDLAALEPDETLSLLPMSRPEVEELIIERLNASHLAPEAMDLILQEAGGHPYFSEELARSMMRSGVLVVEDSAAMLSQGAQQRLSEIRPESVRTILTGRIDRLAPDALQVIRIASVIGRSFDRATLEPVVAKQDTKMDLDGALAELEREQLLLSEGAEHWVFKHALVQDAVYDSMLFSQRADLHRSFATWLEWRHADALEQFHPVLAHHWRLANQRDKALEYLDLAGARALRDFSNLEAIEQFEHALSLGEDVDRERRAHWLRGLGDAHEAMGDLPKSMAYGEASLSALGYAQPASMWSLVPRLYGQLALLILQSWFPGLRAARDEGDRARYLEAARAHLRLTQVYYFINREFWMVYSGVAQLVLTQRVGRSSELAQAYSIMSAVLTTIPMLGLARRWSERARDMAREIGDPWLDAFVMLRHSMIELGESRWNDGQSVLDEATSVAEYQGDWRMYETLTGMSGIQNGFIGRFRRAAQDWSLSLESARQRGNPQAIGWSLLGLGEQNYRMGDHADGIQRMEEALQPLVESGSTTHMYQAHGVLAEALAEEQEFGRARDHIDKAVSLLGYKRPASYFLMYGHAGVASAAIAICAGGSGDAELRTVASKSVRLMETFAGVFPFGLGRAHLLRGRLEAMQGRPDKAMRAWQRGVLAAKAHGMCLDEALCHLEIGARLRDDQPDRAAHLQVATSLFAECGAARQESIARQLLG